MSVRFFWSKSFLLNRAFLWLLFIVNVFGTIYGYIWYGNQLEWTVQNKPIWLLPFVPDSPTSSLFFSIALIYLLFPKKNLSKVASIIRIVIEGLAVVCSIKYGVWAVSMIVAGTWFGDPLHWTHIMLIVSHLSMAIEVLLYLRFMKVRLGGLVIGVGWLFLNDLIDYTFGIYPWLSSRLDDRLGAVMNFTISLSLLSFLLAWVTNRMKKQA